MTRTGGHLIVYRASRLEALVDPLRTLMREAGPSHPLTPVQLVTGHAGMRPWLVRELVRSSEPGGIVANLDIQLPSGYLERLTRHMLGASAVALADYRREHLRWRVFELLPRLAHPDIARYLTGSDVQRRRFQLADHLAGLLSKYIVYRPDWLQAWVDGRSAVVGDRASPLPPLWRALRREIGQPHRGERLQALVEHLQRGAPAGEDSALHLFGISHLAPSELAVFTALASHRPVALYLPDPCREHWLGLQRPRAALRRELDALLARPDGEADADRLWLQQEHPLLAAWGRLGQAFALELDRHDPLSEERHWQDRAQADAPPRNRLERLQGSIRRLDPELLRAPPDRADASLRVHACHTRLRELEVLRDALYDALNAIDGLQPHQIVVMAPDIAAYQPLLPAVFGEPGNPRERLPWHMADAPLLRSHPLLQAFAQVLAMPTSRLPVEEVLALLRVPAVAARLRLDAPGVARIAGWLQQAGVAWALDGAHRAAFDVPAVAAHSFAWGVDRLLAAHVFGDTAGEPVPLPDGGIVPAAVAVEGPQAEELGALDALLRLLQHWRQQAAQARTASDWSERLARLAEALFEVAPADRDGQAAREVLHSLLAEVAMQPAQAGLDPLLAYPVVVEWLARALAAVPARQAFLPGGMTVCGMVPQRAIPFRVVAVLGLDDGQFPRGGGQGGIDLMARHPRLGDRDVRSDDRWLFLETVMAARDRLHLSYLGYGVRDGKPRNPAAPLAELMAVLDAHEPSCAAGGEGQAAARDASWQVEHRLQPFDAVYSAGRDPALFTHERSHVLPARGQHRPAPFADLESNAEACEAAMALPERIALDRVLQWYRDPARQLLRDALGLRLPPPPTPASENEPLDARLPARRQAPRRLLQQAVAARSERLPALPPAAWQLDGALPAGHLGELTWQALSEQVDPALQRLRAQPLFAAGWPPALTQPSQFLLDDCVIEGAAPDAVGDVGHVVVPLWALGRSCGQEGLHRRAVAFVQWALLRLSPSLAEASVELLWLGQKTSRFCADWNALDTRWQRGDAGVRAGIATQLRARLRVLLGLFAAAQRAPLPYFPTSSDAALQGDAHLAWLRERGYGAGEAALLAGPRRFEPGDADTHALEAIAARIAAALAPPADAEATA